MEAEGLFRYHPPQRTAHPARPGSASTTSGAPRGQQAAFASIHYLEVSMSQSEQSPKGGLEAVGLVNLGGVMWNPTAATLYEEFIMNGEGVIAADGPMCGETGKYTGRSPEDKFLVEEPSSKDKIAWGKVNRAFSEDKFERLLHRVQAYLQDEMVYVQDCWAGADKELRIPIRVVTQH